MVWRIRSLAPVAAGLALLAFGAAGSAADHVQRAPTLLSSTAQPSSGTGGAPDCGCNTGGVSGNHNHHHRGHGGGGGGGGVGNGGGGGVGEGGGGGRGGFGRGGGGGFGQGGGGGFGQGGAGQGGQGGQGGSILGSFQGGTTVTVSGSLVGQLAGNGNGNGAGSGNGTGSGSALFSGALSTSTNVNALAALNGSSASGGGGGSGFYVDYNTGYIPNLNVEDASAASSSYQATRQTVKVMAIQAVCLDDKSVPHPASQLAPDKQVPDTYDGEIFRCVAGTRLQFTAAEYDGKVNFDQGQTVTCAKNDALYHTPAGRIECRLQKPARDCNERSLLRRFGAGIKIVKIVWNETYTATREASASSSMGMALDGGVGGVAH